MKKQETTRTYRFGWDSDTGGDHAYATLIPGDPDEVFSSGVARVRRQEELDPLNAMDFYHPDDLEAFGNGLVKLAGEMRKWPEFKPARRSSK